MLTALSTQEDNNGIADTFFFLMSDICNFFSAL